MKWRVLVPALAAAALRLGFSAGVRDQSLREAAQSSGVLVGAAVKPAQLSEAAYASTLAREFNMLEPEDVLKWEEVHPEPQSFDFSHADQIVDFAIRHGMKVRGHTLVWHHQNPQWLTEGKYTSGELWQILEKHIKSVVGHYRGKIFAWDVVNEAFDELQPGKLRSTIWRDQPGIGLAGNGSSYIERCFRWAHEADPQALLFYNEAGAEVVNPKSDAIYAMVRDFRQRGIPIDGVGFSDAHREVARRCRIHFCQYQALRGSGRGGPYHRDGRRPASWSERQSSLRGSATAGGHLSRACHRLSVSSRMHGDPDMGLHGQIFLDRIALEACARRGVAV